MDSLSTLLQQLTEKQQKLQTLLPMPYDQQEHLEEWLKVELTYSSNAIEGNTLTRIETAEVIEKGVGVIISGKSLKDQLEAINHAKAIGFVRELSQKMKSHQQITEQDILEIQKILLAGIHDDWAGKYRTIEIFVRGSNTDFPLPQDVSGKMKRFISFLQEQQGEHPVILAAEAHFKLVSIHPFRDGNGRTSRLLMNLILLIHGFPMAVIRQEQREEYLALFDRVRKTNDMQPFYEFVALAVDRSLNAYLNAAEGKPILAAFKEPQEQVLLRIGELAKQTGVSEHTLRFWTDEGLLTASRTSGNYRLYDSSTVGVIKEIQRLKDELRLTLPEIKKRLQKFGTTE
jgi:Fic family protein